MNEILKKFELLNDFYLTLKGISLYYVSFKDNPYKSTDFLKEYQYKKLKKLLIESHRNVPYYTQLFKKIKFNPIRDFNAIKDINKIPILEKETVRQNPELFYNQKINKYLTLHTSGSTGNPLQVRVSYNAWIVEQASVWRHWKWAGYKFRDKMAIVRSYVPENNSKLTKYDYIRNFKYYSPFHINEHNGILYLKDMINEKIKFLRGYPSSIKVLADIAIKNNINLRNIKGIFVASERLSRLQRQTISKAFNCKVYNHYGQADISITMANCNKTNLLHNFEDYGYLELESVDSFDNNIKQIIGTNLHNYAMPLIRYKTNDLAELSETEYKSTKKFRTIKNIYGRNDSVIKTKSGYMIPTVNFYTMFDTYLNIKQWQIIQKDLNNIEFIIKYEGIVDEIIKTNIKTDIFKRLNDEINIKLSFNSKFIQKNEGKIPTFISLL